MTKDEILAAIRTQPEPAKSKRITYRGVTLYDPAQKDEDPREVLRQLEELGVAGDRNVWKLASGVDLYEDAKNRDAKEKIEAARAAESERENEAIELRRQRRQDNAEAREAARKTAEDAAAERLREQRLGVEPKFQPPKGAA
jgi:hypothetical protein